MNLPQQQRKASQQREASLLRHPHHTCRRAPVIPMERPRLALLVHRRWQRLRDPPHIDRSAPAAAAPPGRERVNPPLGKRKAPTRAARASRSGLHHHAPKRAGTGANSPLSECAACGEGPGEGPPRGLRRTSRRSFGPCGMLRASAVRLGLWMTDPRALASAPSRLTSSAPPATARSPRRPRRRPRRERPSSPRRRVLRCSPAAARWPRP